MRIAGTEFRPRLWPSLITLILLGILLSLGFWQLDRAEQKRALLAEYHGPGEATVIRLEPGTVSIDGRRYRFASAVGRYDPAHQFLLDNRVHRGRVGYHVLTPFKLRDSQVAVLVNRGWVPIEGDRTRLPDPHADEMPKTVKGRIRQPPTGGFMLGEEVPRRGWPYRIQRIDLDRLQRELGYTLLPVVLLLDPEQPDGFARDWTPLRFGPERNVGYAVQWFGLAAALLVIYLVVNLRRTD
jgi:surfeit locus 1 family protein